MWGGVSPNFFRGGATGASKQILSVGSGAAAHLGLRNRAYVLTKSLSYVQAAQDRARLLEVARTGNMDVSPVQHSGNKGRQNSVSSSPA